ncbi:PPA1309 family protein [soil metagenome]
MRVSESGLRRAVLEIDAALAQRGWDQPARLYALVATSSLLEQEPALAGSLGLAGGSQGQPADGLTAVEQDPLPPESSLEDLLPGIEWPADVGGCAAAVERVVLPPSAEVDMPADPTEMRTYASQHPDRHEVRIVAAALRGGQAHCTLRIRGQEDGDLLEGADLVPGLVAMITETLTGS